MSDLFVTVTHSTLAIPRGFLPIYIMLYYRYVVLCSTEILYEVNIVIGWKVKKEKQTFFLADIFICFAYTVYVSGKN